MEVSSISEHNIVTLYIVEPFGIVYMENKHYMHAVAKFPPIIQVYRM